MSPTSSLLRLFQLCDSAFPTGAYAFSDGLETYTQAGLVATPAQLYEILAAQLAHGWGTLDLPACALAWSAYPESGRLLELDEHLSALKVVEGVRGSSLRVGATLARTARTLWPELGGLPCHQAAVFGAVARALEIPRREAVAGLASSWLTSKVTASTRLFRLGGLEAQQVLAGLHPLAAAAVEQALAAGLDDLCSFTPALDLAARRQSELSLRLFQS